ncbi:MAG: hypothetical protein K2Y23_06360 [Cyanobacteria bacterium]|nr:hypothetical protein [Cyanobacteriota bacterium]
MIRSRRSRLVMSAIALCMAVVPSYTAPRHAHEQTSGAILVHSHPHEEHAGHSNAIDHGAEKQIPAVSTAFRVERTLEITPVVLTAVIPVPAHTPELASNVPEDDPVIHGPPIAVPSLRAPPA